MWQRIVNWLVETCWAHSYSMDYKWWYFKLWGHHDHSGGYVTEKFPCIMCPMNYLSSWLIPAFVKGLEKTGNKSSNFVT